MIMISSGVNQFFSVVTYKLNEYGNRLSSRETKKWKCVGNVLFQEDYKALSSLLEESLLHWLDSLYTRSHLHIKRTINSVLHLLSKLKLLERVTVALRAPEKPGTATSVRFRKYASWSTRNRTWSLVICKRSVLVA